MKYFFRFLKFWSTNGNVSCLRMTLLLFTKLGNINVKVKQSQVGPQNTSWSYIAQLKSVRFNCTFNVLIFNGGVGTLWWFLKENKHTNEVRNTNKCYMISKNSQRNDNALSRGSKLIPHCSISDLTRYIKIDLNRTCMLMWWLTHKWIRLWHLDIMWRCVSFPNQARTKCITHWQYIGPHWLSLYGQKYTYN